VHGAGTREVGTTVVGVIRPERADDVAELDAIDTVVRRSFARPDEADLLRALRTDPDWLPGLALVHVDDEGRIDGQVAFTRLRVVLGDPAYYARFGFVPAQGMGLTGPFDAEAGEAVQALALAEGPHPHGRVRYAAAFGIVDTVDAD
jgi:putative acetyltransferase